MHLFPGGILAAANKHDTFWHVASTEYFYVLFLWAIAVSDSSFLEIYKDLGCPLSTNMFTVNSHTDNDFYKYIYLFQILYSMKSVFLLKHTLRFFIFKFEIKCEASLLFFQIKTMTYRKDTLQKKIWKNYWMMLYTDDVTGNLSWWNNGGNNIYKKHQ